VSEQEPSLPERTLPEDELETRRREAAAEAAPHHCIYLGMAPGVGKTVAALHKLRRLRSSGLHVIVGYVETCNRAGTVEALGDLATIPRRKLRYKGLVHEEMDLDEILLRHPDVVMIDELAHSNVTGSRHAKRWQDVQAILDDGISVISTLNIQHLESLADIVAAITGVEVHERVPDEVVQQAGEIKALRRYFREGTLAAARRHAHIVVGHAHRGRLQELLRTSVADNVLRPTSDVDIHVVATNEHA